MNMGVFRIHDRNTLYKIGDLKVWGKFGFGPNLPRLKWPNLLLTDYFQISCDSSFKMEKKLSMFYIEAHNPLVIKNIEFKSESLQIFRNYYEKFTDHARKQVFWYKINVPFNNATIVCTHVDKLVTSNFQICFPALYLI